MGLDMFLERFPIVIGKVGRANIPLEPKHFNAINSWASYQDYLARPLRNDETEKCSWEEWTGNAKYLPDKETVEKLSQGMNLSEEVGYWRKANAIHLWFVDKIQDGEDDCCYHRPITVDELEELRDTCQEVLDSLGLEKGKVANGYSFNADGTKNYIYEDGMVATDTSLAEELLPTQSGFFFGSTDYDEYYAQDLQHTIEVVNDVLKTTDFEKELIYYYSSW